MLCSGASLLVQKSPAARTGRCGDDFRVSPIRPGADGRRVSNDQAPQLPQSDRFRPRKEPLTPELTVNQVGRRGAVLSSTDRYCSSYRLRHGTEPSSWRRARATIPRPETFPLHGRQAGHPRRDNGRFYSKRVHSRLSSVAPRSNLSRRPRNAMTLEEIARRVKVSTITVSRVLNNSGVVKETTRKRVEIMGG